MSKKLRPELWEEGPKGPALLGVACPQCGGKYFPPRKACPNCCCAVLAPARLAGRGSIYSSTKVWIPSPKVKEHPYHIGYVELAEGITVPAVFTGANEYPIGSRVEMVIDILRTEGEVDVFCYKFRPVPLGGEDR